MSKIQVRSSTQDTLALTKLSRKRLAQADWFAPFVMTPDQTFEGSCAPHMQMLLEAVIIDGISSGALSSDLFVAANRRALDLVMQILGAINALLR